MVRYFSRPGDDWMERSAATSAQEADRASLGLGIWHSLDMTSPSTDASSKASQIGRRTHNSTKAIGERTIIIENDANSSAIASIPQHTRSDVMRPHGEKIPDRRPSSRLKIRGTALSPRTHVTTVVGDESLAAEPIDFHCQYASYCKAQIPSAHCVPCSSMCIAPS
jgi:hypothetical protein